MTPASTPAAEPGPSRCLQDGIPECEGRPRASLGADLSLALPLIAHDLRGSLTMVRTSLQLLGRMARSAQELDRDRVARLVEQAEVAVGQLERQISALAPEPAPPRPPSEPPAPGVDLVRAVQLLAHFYQQTTARHEIIVTAVVPALPGPWSRLQLERVLGNLLDNAIKYSPSGGTIRVRVDCEEEASGRWATLCVQNHGIGIPAADLAQLAQAGYRASNVGAIPGTGLGLASVHEVVAQCGGTFAIESEVGGSTTVEIRLPVE